MADRGRGAIGGISLGGILVIVGIIVRVLIAYILVFSIMAVAGAAERLSELQRDENHDD